MIWPADDTGIITAIVFPNEGGLVNNRADRGGITNRGITKPALAEFRSVPVSQIADADIVNLSDAEAIALYRRDYIERPGFDKITSVKLRTAAVDMAVLFGQTGADEALERTEHAALGIKQAAGQQLADGLISDVEAVEINKLEPRAVINALSVIRILHHADVVARRPNQVGFLKGWDDRACRFIE